VSALNLASAVAFVLVVIALLPRLRQSLKEQQPQPRPYWPLVAFSAGVALVFQLINALID
jgi:hypothetical protein